MQVLQWDKGKAIKELDKDYLVWKMILRELPASAASSAFL